VSRIVIAGWPRAGKTFFADALGKELGITVRHTDDVMQLGWSESSLEVSTWLEDAGPFIVEGVATVRALRKWLDRNPQGTPADVLYWSAVPREDLTSRQAGMGKGCTTVLDEIRDELVKRGVRMEFF
jgi:adenylate kinase family enzyme